MPSAHRFHRSEVEFQQEFNVTTTTLRTALLTLPVSLAFLVSHASAATSAPGGAFRTLNAPTTGSVRIVTTAAGSELQLLNLKTEPGPGLKVWLFEDPAPAKGTSDTTIAQGKYIEVGALKTFKGTFRFVLPANTVVSDYRSVVLWCSTVKTSFAAAPLN